MRRHPLRDPGPELQHRLRLDGRRHHRRRRHGRRRRVIRVQPAAAARPAGPGGVDVPHGVPRGPGQRPPRPGVDRPGRRVGHPAADGDGRRRRRQRRLADGPPRARPGHRRPGRRRPTTTTTRSGPGSMSPEAGTTMQRRWSAWSRTGAAPTPSSPASSSGARPALPSSAATRRRATPGSSPSPARPASPAEVAVAVIVEAQPGVSEVTGGRVAAPIARSVMAAVLGSPE